MDTTTLSAFIQTQLSAPPKPWLRIRGTRKSKSRHEVSDFDFRIPCSSYTTLSELELESSPDSTRRHGIDISDCHTDEEAIDRAARLLCDSINNNDEELRGLSIHKLIGNYTSSLPLIISQIREIASRIGYEGNVLVTLHDYFVPEVASVGDAEEGAVLEASWRFNWPASSVSTDTDRSEKGVGETKWAKQIGYAMIKGEKGWVDLDNENELVSRGVSAFGYPVKGGSAKESISEVRFANRVGT